MYADDDVNDDNPSPLKVRTYGASPSSFDYTIAANLNFDMIGSPNYVRQVRFNEGQIMTV